MPTDQMTGFQRQTAPLYLPRFVKERKEMIRQAMEEKAPAMLNQLTMDKELEEYLTLKEEAMFQEFDQEYNQIQGEISRSTIPHLKKMQEFNTRILEAWHQAMDNHLEFPTTESSREG